jgi:DNA-binding PadR family transcriptional regulator
MPTKEDHAMGNEGRTGAKPLTSSVFYILLALADKDRHGLGIAEEVEKRTGGEVEMGPGTLYMALRKMLADGLIEESDQRPAPDDDDPRRRYYHITAAGRHSASAEAARLERIVLAARKKDLLSSRGRS